MRGLGFRLPEMQERFCLLCGKPFMAMYENSCYCSSCQKSGESKSSKKKIKEKDKPGRTNPLNFSWQRATEKTNPKRKCHDCGKATYNYRCDKCWEKKRGGFWDD